MNPQDKLKGIADTGREIQSAVQTMPQGNDAFTGALEKTLLANSNLISSANSGLETAIGKSIEAIRQGQQASASRTNTTFDRLESNVLRSGVASQVDATETRRGFATQTAVLRNILDTTNSELSNLRDQRQDLLLAGEAEAASQISGLMVKQAEARQQAMQQAFSNQLSMINAAIGVEGVRMQRQQMRRQARMDIFAMDQAEFQNSIAEQELAMAQAQNEFERTMATENLNIRKSELALSQARLAIESNKPPKIQPSAGFADLEAEGNIRAVVADRLANVTAALERGEISDEDAIGMKLAIYNDVRTRTPENIASNEALLGTVGLPVAESAEASRALAQSELAPLPSGGSGIFSAKDAIVGARNVSSNIFAGIGEFITGGDIPGFGFGN